MLGVECGYTPAEIRQMTMIDVRRIFDHFKRTPPLRTLVAACAKALGIEFPDPDAPKPQYMDADDMRAFMARTGGKLENM